MTAPNTKPARPRVAMHAAWSGFSLRLEVHPSLPLIECQQFERRFEDFAQALGLEFRGHQPNQFVCAVDRPTTANDQVAVIDWLVDQPGVIAVRVGQIVSVLGESKANSDDTFVQARTGDFALIGLTLLYRCGRITATLYLQILRGCVRPAHLH